MYVIVSGNPIDGVSLFGPFEEHEDAREAASANLDSDWWIAELETPQELAE